MKESLDQGLLRRAMETNDSKNLFLVQNLKNHLMLLLNGILYGYNFTFMKFWCLGVYIWWFILIKIKSVF
ncbi:hypothetical protein CHH92_22630 [Bacillus sonorensis]|uniref:Uncharacterized protein n=1 Tax=Bacillus sonorensis L12 TaxID=1274524 RepID=M5PA66_9BACI|nr:hypothetical protein BSONL12_22870 [Bacillus sonorensis L12]PAD57910.1 hypothetical protein CHH92_22630 [Bacillus sonorensis]